MSEPYIGQIGIMGFNYAPQNVWAYCNGQSLAIQQNSALYALLGTTFGGNGTTTFNLPDLRGRVPICQNPAAGLWVGNAGGSETVTLTQGQLPNHTHTMAASSAYASTTTGGATVPSTTSFLAATGNPTTTPPDVTNIYGSAAALTPLNAAAITPTGGNAAHSNMQPFLALNFCIALLGIWPSRN